MTPHWIKQATTEFVDLVREHERLVKLRNEARAVHNARIDECEAALQEVVGARNRMLEAADGGAVVLRGGDGLFGDVVWVPDGRTFKAVPLVAEIDLRETAEPPAEGGGA